jgi:uncharacterized membrane protein YqjE
MNWLSLLGLEAFVARWQAAGLEGAIAAQDRLELAHLEWQDQKKRLIQVLVLAIGVAALTVVAFVVFSIALMVHFWDTDQRTMVAWIVAGVWVVGWGGALAALISIATTSAEAFAFTRRELVRDWTEIKERL